MSFLPALRLIPISAYPDRSVAGVSLHVPISMSLFRLLLSSGRLQAPAKECTHEPLSGGQKCHQLPLTTSGADEKQGQIYVWVFSQEVWPKN